MNLTVGTSAAFLPTGIPHLDGVLGGGLPEGSVVFVVGAPGTGKTTLVSQIAMHTARTSQRVVFVSTLSEAASRLVRHMRSFSFWDQRFVGRELVMTSIDPAPAQSRERIIEALVNTVRAQGARLLVIDGFQTLCDMYPQPADRRTLLHQLAALLAPLGCTTLVTSSAVPDMGKDIAPEYAICDGIIELSQRDPGAEAQRALRVWKMRCAANVRGQHTLRMTPDGILLYPRTESRAVSVTDEPEPGRMSTGTRELDAMLNGGFPRGSVTILAGAPGTGKTLLALQYLAEGARCGEPGLLFGFRESERQLRRKLETFQVDLGPASEASGLEIVRRAPVDLEADVVIDELAAILEERKIQRLVIDSIRELEQAVPDERRRYAVMAWLLELLRARGITAVLTRGMGQIIGPELDFADSPLELVAENVLLLRYVEYGGRLSRILSVLKMRDTAHDASIREYEIDDQAFRVLPAVDSKDGLLTSIADLASERRVKRMAEGAKDDS